MYRSAEHEKSEDRAIWLGAFLLFTIPIALIIVGYMICKFI